MKSARVMVVDDSAVIRRLISDTLGSHPQIDVVAAAANGRLALDLLETTAVDIIVLDIEMPVLDGVATVRELRRSGKRMPVIMFSTLTERGARVTLDALTAGATDYVTKPSHSNSIEESRNNVRTQLIPRVLALTGIAPLAAPTFGPSGEPTDSRPLRPRRPVEAADRAPDVVAPTSYVEPVETKPSAPRPGERFRSVPTSSKAHRVGSVGAHAKPRAVPVDATSQAPRSPRTVGGKGIRLLVIGTSTGGPEALNKVLPALPASLSVPVLIVQHMPPIFTRLLAERLDRSCGLTVSEAAGGELLRPGLVYIAPGDAHLEIEMSGADAFTKITDGPPENFCRPAVDVLFRSAAKVFSAGVLGVILTGMGSDGRLGSRDIVAAGGLVIAQDQESSVVWGMPGSVANDGCADEILGISQIASAIVQRISGSVRADTSLPPITAHATASAASSKPTVRRTSL